MKVEDPLDGATNFISWKFMFLLILEENDLLKLSMRKFQNQKRKKTSPNGGSVMRKQEGFWWTQSKITWFLKSQKRRQLGICQDLEEVI